MSIVFFYGLNQQSIEYVLPRLLEKTLKQGWRAIVRVGSPERMKALDAVLWTYSEGSFLPHSADASWLPDEQPILLTDTDTNLNKAQVLFLVDVTKEIDFVDYERVVYIFDSRDDTECDILRKVWKHLQEDGTHDVTYWKQNERGKWIDGGQF